MKALELGTVHRSLNRLADRPLTLHRPPSIIIIIHYRNHAARERVLENMNYL